MAKASGLHPEDRGFESHFVYHLKLNKDNFMKIKRKAEVSETSEGDGINLELKKAVINIVKTITNSREQEEEVMQKIDKKIRELADHIWLISDYVRDSNKILGV